MFLHYLGKQETRKLSFHLNAACFLPKTHNIVKNITWWELNHPSLSNRSQQMLDAIKHISQMTTFSFRKTAHRCILCVTQSNWVKMWFSRFPDLPGSAEAQVTWGGIVKCLLIAYFIGNISAKKYQNLFMCVKVIASQRWDVFWDTVYNATASCANNNAIFMFFADDAFHKGEQNFI